MYYFSLTKIEVTAKKLTTMIPNEDADINVPESVELEVGASVGGNDG